MNRFKKMILIGSLSALLIACEATFDTEKVSAEKEAEDKFFEEPKRPNHDLQSVSLRLPFGLTVEEDNGEEIILYRDDQPYVLQAQSLPEVGEQSTYLLVKGEGQEPWIIDQTYEDAGAFGYVLVRELGTDEYEVVTGVNDAYFTTISSTDQLSDDVKWMMESARTLTYREV